MPNLWVLEALDVFMILSIFSRNNQNVCSCKVFCFNFHVHTIYPPCVIAEGGDDNMYHVSGIFLPYHQKLVCLCHCPRVSLLSLCIGVLYIIYQFSKSGLIFPQNDGNCQWFLYVGLLVLYHLRLFWRPQYLWVGLSVQWQIYHSYLNTERTSSVFHDFNVISEGLVMYRYRSVLVLSEILQTPLEIVYCVWWVFFYWKLNITVLMFFSRDAGSLIREIIGWSNIPLTLACNPPLNCTTIVSRRFSFCHQ